MSLAGGRVRGRDDRPGRSSSRCSPSRSSPVRPPTVTTAAASSPLCYLAQVLISTGLATRSALGGGLWPIFALAALFGCARAFFQPTASALGPMLVPLSITPAGDRDQFAGRPTGQHPRPGARRAALRRVAGARLRGQRRALRRRRVVCIPDPRRHPAAVRARAGRGSPRSGKGSCTCGGTSWCSGPSPSTCSPCCSAARPACSRCSPATCSRSARKGSASCERPRRSGPC